MMQLMYENMRVRVETVVKSGIISHDYINSKQELEAFIRWTDGFTSQNHPAVIQVYYITGTLVKKIYIWVIHIVAIDHLTKEKRRPLMEAKDFNLVLI